MIEMMMRMEGGDEIQSYSWMLAERVDDDVHDDETPFRPW
jgi:hypothetical protein